MLSGTERSRSTKYDAVALPTSCHPSTPLRVTYGGIDTNPSNPKLGFLRGARFGEFILAVTEGCVTAGRV